MGYKYLDKHIAFLKKNIPGRSYAEVTELFNRRFGLLLSFTQMKSLLKNHNLVNGFGHGNPTIPRERKYMDKHLRYLRKIVPGTPFKTVLKKFNVRFGFSIGIDALKGLCGKYRINNGRDSRFRKGSIPPNKGKKGIYYDGCQVSWFKKGQMPVNTMPIGSERVTVDGYVEVKYSDRSGPQKNRWKGKHTLIWEKEYGPVPKGSVVIFLDGNRQNFKLSNLRMISRAELVVMNKRRLFSNNKEMTNAGYAIAAVRVAMSRRKRGTFTGVKKRKMIFLNNSGSKVYITIGKVGGKERYYAVRENKHGVYRLRVKTLKTRATFEEAQRDLYEYALRRGWQRI